MTDADLTCLLRARVLDAQEKAVATGGKDLSAIREFEYWLREFASLVLRDGTGSARRAVPSPSATSGKGLHLVREAAAS
ncbi:MAG TPA: hypothetical protein VHB50_17200 [Bryobacteraceae bacterium]|nr:hypothetical protein [Bryobacteraceae bacterium]